MNSAFPIPIAVAVVVIVGVFVAIPVYQEQAEAIDKAVAEQWAEKALNETNVTVVQNGTAVELPNGRVVEVPDRENMSVDISINLTASLGG